jgi:preprotein translocase subunit SecG
MDYLAVTMLMLTGIFLILLVLVQRGRGGGLAGAFGGMGGQSAFGTKAGDVFTRITIVVAILWVVLAGASIHALRSKSLFEGGADLPGLQSAGGDDEIPVAPDTSAEPDPSTTTSGTPSPESPDSSDETPQSPDTEADPSDGAAAPAEPGKTGPAFPQPQESTPPADESSADEKPEASQSDDSE